MFVWTEEKIRWYQQAANYTKYYQKIFQEMKPFIHKQHTVCDLGCGLGDLSMELAKVAKEVTALDISEDALRVVEQKAAAQKITNIVPLQSDWRNIELIPQWDMMVVSFFRQNYEDFIQLLKMSRERIMVVATNGSEKNFLPKKKKKRSNKKKIAELKQSLDQYGVTYQCKESIIEFGQPFTTVEDAKNYVRVYVPYRTPEEIQHHIDTHLQAIDDPEFGYQFLLPNKKEIGIFIIEKQSALEKLPEFNREK